MVPLPIVGLLSTFAEGPLGEAAARSLAKACDKVIVGEGPIGPAPGRPGEDSPHRWPSIKSGHVLTGRWPSDAAKRTALVLEAQRTMGGVRAMGGRPFWAVWLDGDELLLNPESLRLWCWRAEREQWDSTSSDLKISGGFPLRLVELDGTVVQAMGRVLRGDLVESYLHSIVEVKMHSALSSIPLPNVPNWSPAQLDEDGSVKVPADPLSAYRRPPLQGEPHVLHLSSLRDPARTAERQSEAEQRGYRERAEAMGIALPA